MKVSRRNTWECEDARDHVLRELGRQFSEAVTAAWPGAEGRKTTPQAHWSRHSHPQNADSQGVRCQEAHWCVAACAETSGCRHAATLTRLYRHGKLVTNAVTPTMQVRAPSVMCTLLHQQQSLTA